MLRLLPPTITLADHAGGAFSEVCHAYASDDWTRAKRVQPIRVLLVGGDRIYAGALRSAVVNALPGAFVRCGVSFEEADRIFADGTADLFLVGGTMADDDVLGLLGREAFDSRQRPRVLAITARREPPWVVALSEMCEGIFDPSIDGSVELKRAIRCVADGGVYWSASVLTILNGMQQREGPGVSEGPKSSAGAFAADVTRLPKTS